MKFEKDFIDISTERLPESPNSRAVSARCLGCPQECMILFNSQSGFAFAAKLASVFSSLCKKLEKEAELKERLGGQLSLLSDVNSED
jgi:hypothetical protein